MTVWYRQGTASIENGSTSVSGTLTAWTAMAIEGDGISFDGGGTWYEIAAVDGNTALTLASAFAGETVVGGAYAIDRKSARRGDVSRALAIVQDLLASVSGVILTDGAPSDALGNDGMLAFDADAQQFYFKAGGEWSEGTSFKGNGGWSPIFAVATDGARRVLQVADWVGGEGNAPDIGAYIGASGLTETIGEAVDIRGPQGDPGNDGWSPVEAIEIDGERRVKKVVDWAGGEGTKPATGKYLGASGWVDTAAEALDVRGPSGSGDLSGPGATVSDEEIAVWDGASGTAMKGSGVGVSADDTLSADSDALLPTQAAVRGYVISSISSAVAGIRDGVSSALDTFAEVAAALAGKLTASNNLSDVANASTARTNLGLAIGTDVQAYNAALSALIRQASKSANFTATASEVGYDIFHPASDDNARTFTIPSNASVPFAIGTCISFTNMVNTVTIAISSDTLTWLGPGGTGSRTLAPNGMAVARKVAATQWVISGINLS